MGSSIRGEIEGLVASKIPNISGLDPSRQGISLCDAMTLVITGTDLLEFKVDAERGTPSSDAQMKTTKSLILISTFIIVGASWLIIGGASSGGVETSSRGELSNPSTSFLKIGGHYIRMEHVDYTSDEPEGITVIFQSQNSLKLKGPDAELLRSWLNANSITPPDGSHPPNPPPKN